MCAALTFRLAALSFVTTTIAGATRETNYVSLAKRSYRAGIDDRHTCHAPRGSGVRAAGCCRGGCAPDTWALGAALLWKRERDPYFRQQAHEQLTNFTLLWLNTTVNGTLVYGRSGFFGWMLPLAYAELRAAGALPPWNASFTTLFKRACHSFLAPQIISEDGTKGDIPGCDPSAPHSGSTYGCAAGDGYWEIGNWNKGFNHWADSVAMLHAFGDDWDAAPGVNGMYKTYNARMHNSWVAQHPYEENSCNYNGISYFCAAAIGYMLNDTRGILPRSVRDVFVDNYAHSFIPSGPNAGCMPGWGGSNTACENAPQWGPTFEMIGAIWQEPILRFGATLLFNASDGQQSFPGDPTTYMLANEWRDSTVPIAAHPLNRANLAYRRSPGLGINASKDGDEYASLRPDKLIITRNATIQSTPFAPNSSTSSSGGKGAPGWVMMELFATTTLYHAVPTLPGHLIHFTANGSLFMDSPRKHWPHPAQGNQMVMIPIQPTAELASKGRAVFPWYSAQQLVTPGGDWQLASVPTRFLGAQSNDAKYMTARQMRQDSFAIVCMSGAGYNSTSGGSFIHSSFDLFVDEFFLVGPNGTKLIDNFESGGDAWPHGSLVSGGANGSKFGLKIRCPANSTLTSRRPLSATPNLDLNFDSVLDYDHILFWFKVSEDYTNSPLSQDFPFAINASTSIGNMAPLGHFRDRHVGTDGGNLHSNAVCMIDQTEAKQLNETTNDNSIWMPTVVNASASSNGAGDGGGGLQLKHSYFYGAEHDRVIALLEEDALVVFDRVRPPTGIGTASSFYVGPVFNMRSSVTPARAAGAKGEDNGFIVTGFEGSFDDQQLAVWFGGSSISTSGGSKSGGHLTVNHTGPCGGARGANPTPDACRVDAPNPVPGGSFSQVFSLAEVPSGSSAGFVTVLVPAGTVEVAREIVSTASAKFADPTQVEVSLPALGKRVHLSAAGAWMAEKI